MTLVERFMQKTMYAGDCIVWTAYTTHKGYGMFSWGRTKWLAHRAAYVLFIGPIPEGKQLDHLCRNRACVNVAHLKVVTARENSQAPGSLTPSNLARFQTHCKRGHEYSEENLYRHQSIEGERVCKICHMLRVHKYRQRLKEGMGNGIHKKIETGE